MVRPFDYFDGSIALTAGFAHFDELSASRAGRLRTDTLRVKSCATTGSNNGSANLHTSAS